MQAFSCIVSEFLWCLQGPFDLEWCPGRESLMFGDLRITDGKVSLGKLPFLRLSLTQSQMTFLASDIGQ